MANPAVHPFIFPPNRFPSFDPVPDPPPPAEEFGPPLSFDPHGAAYQTDDLTFHQPAYQFTPKQGEIAAKKMDVSYNVVEDCYRRNDLQGDRGWAQSLWRYCNVSRKVEEDWAMAYLARTDIFKENILNAVMEYRFNLRDAGAFGPILNQ